MARPLWKGTLGFGLVSIPVEVMPAVKDLGPHFHFLRKSDKSRIGYQKIAKADNEPVSSDELVKGYEYEKGRYVVLTARDFESAAVERSGRIDLLDFVDGDEVDDRYFDKPYYLLPGKGGTEAYAILREALRDSGRIGIAKLVMRDQPHLAAVEVIKDALVLSTMRFREELVPVTAYEFPPTRVREADARIARQLVDGLAAEWDPDKYTDEYRANLMAIIEAKRTHEKPQLEKQEVEAGSNVVDLMERLRRSLQQGGRSRKGSARPAQRRAKKTGAAKRRSSTRRSTKSRRKAA